MVFREIFSRIRLQDTTAMFEVWSFEIGENIRNVDTEHGKNGEMIAVIFG